ncbi:MAG: DUF881 domain-containing protein [Selenomonadaceae bacterium]|nr:DUF881 domain-containing protein [Selenomonadaceae bacterium]MBR3721425.1 DUF881 domain-containing protein [Selenomonadaceae bacterium]
MKIVKRGQLSIASVCMVVGFLLALQFRMTEDMRESLPYQRVEELSDRLIQTEKERDALLEEVANLNKRLGGEQETALRRQAALTAMKGEGVIVKMDDSKQTARAGENANLYIIHDDDMLRVINELRAAGAEAISINGQRLIGTSEIRCAGPTLSVNNVRSAAPFEIRAIGDKKNLESALKMRGGVAETLKVWGIQLEIAPSDSVYVPPYRGVIHFNYAKTAEEE